MEKYKFGKPCDLVFFPQVVALTKISSDAKIMFYYVELYLLKKGNEKLPCEFFTEELNWTKGRFMHAISQLRHYDLCESVHTPREGQFGVYDFHLVFGPTIDHSKWDGKLKFWANSYTREMISWFGYMEWSDEMYEIDRMVAQDPNNGFEKLN